LANGAELYRLKLSGLSWAQIAEKTGLSQNTARMRLRRYVKKVGRSEAEIQVKENRDPSRDAVSVIADQNVQEIESKSARITSLEQLVSYCKIDLQAWTIEKHVINKWEVGTKHPETGEVIVEPLFQVKAWLARKHPEAIRPAISPVEIRATYSSRAGERRGLKKALIIPDAQIGFSREVMKGKLTPFHDRSAIDIVLQLAQLIRPDITITIGDTVDLSGWSDKYIVRPEFYFTTQPALIEAAWMLANLRKNTGSMYYLEGNHDIRLENQIVSHLVAAYGLRSADQLEAAPVMSLNNLLGLQRIGIDYVGGYPDAEVWINDRTRAVHGDRVRGVPGHTASAVVREADETTIFGHIHRRELATRTIPYRGGYRTISAFSPGCLCHIDGRVPGSTKSNQWQQGAAVVYYDDETSTIVPIDIFQGRAIFEGKVIEGRDYIDALRKDTSWEF
jgi:hypothetical protein